MFEVTGKVQLAESGLGIRDLVVVAFDADAAAPLASNARPPDGIVFMGRYAGNRLGSVMTESGGQFKLAFEPPDFAAADAEGRPDLLLVVLSPERTVDGSPDAVPMEQRVLFTHVIPAANAGRREAFVISLREAALRRHGVPVPNPREPMGGGTLLAQQIIQGSSEVTRSIHHATRTALTEPFALNRQARTAATAKFANFSLSKFARSQREQPFYFQKGQDLMTKMTGAMRARIDEMANRGRRATMRVLIEEARVREIGLTIDGGRIAGQVERPYSDLAQYVDAAQDLTTLTQSQVFGACHAEAEAERRITALLAGETDEEDGGSGDGEEDADTGTPTSFVRSMVDRQVSGARSADAGISIETRRPTQDTIEHTVQSFEVRGGPADATAFHDFYDLQIAFEHVWTELFDHRLTSKGKSLYEAWAKLENEVSGLPPEEVARSVESEEELQQYLDEAHEFFDRLVALNPPPTAVKKLAPEITSKLWNGLEPDDQAALIEAAATFELLVVSTYAKELRPVIEGQRAALRATAQEILTRSKERRPRFVEQIEELKGYLLEPHRFDIFAPDAINFGLMVNYRQQWKPLTYQVGDLVSTLPLAPKEVRRYTRKEVVKKSRAQKEIEDAQRIRKSDAQTTARVDAEIVQRASSKTNFNANVQGGFNVGVGTINVGSGFSTEADNQSSKTKKDFRESVLKAAEEYKQERRTEISFESSVEIETTESGEIFNPNEELTVTYLFYELQRQYEIAEAIQGLTPVVLVANEVPAPHEIDESWLMTHEWILSRTLLDDRLRPAFDLVREGLGGDQIALEVKRINWHKQMELVQKLEATADRQSSIRDEFRERLLTATERQGKAAATELSRDEKMAADILDPLGLFHDEDAVLTADLLEAERKTLESRLSHAESVLAETQRRLTAGSTALEAATEAYTTLVQYLANKQAQIDQLRAHVKDNILYYMQAVWLHEPPDQRFFRLYQVRVPWIPPPDARLSTSVTAHGVNAATEERFALLRELGVTDLYPVDLEIQFPEEAPVIERRLVEVADLDNLLGFKGNYMIFPLKENHYLTYFMRLNFVEQVRTDTARLRDPDDLANVSVDALASLMECVRRKNPALFETNRERWKDVLAAQIANESDQPNRIIVPSKSLYIEALPGARPILEDFKLLHRILDVRKVQGEVRKTELENVRFAARLLEGERGDPDVDRSIVVHGANPRVVVEE